MEQELEIDNRKMGDVVILAVKGTVTTGSREQALKEAIQHEVDGRNFKLLIDLQDVEFIDSSGVGVLVKSYTTLAGRGGRLKLLRPGKMVRHTLNITGLLGIFEVFDDEAAAIRSF